MTIRSRDELYAIYKNAAETISPALTDWFEGSINDSQAGAASTMASELTKTILDEFLKTFIDTADGSEETGGNDDLEDLLVDHFGADFARPAAEKAIGTVKFERESALAGTVQILAGTKVKSDLNANGQAASFKTILDVELVDTEIYASIEADDAGTVGNVASGEIKNIETTLTDPTITVTNEDATSGGHEEYNDAEYREWAYNQIRTLKGAIKESLESVAENVAGVNLATAIEKLTNVREWDIGGGVSIGDTFQIARSTVYIADANGTANDALVALVDTEMNKIRAAGVKVAVEGAVAKTVDWSANITLDAGGPSYAELSQDATPIIDSMKKYINDLAIGQDFIRNLAEAAILSIWGPDGTGDLVDEGFETAVPTGDVAMDENEKAIQGTVGV